MDAALGPPEKMTERADDLTPMMRQYFELCADYEDSLLLFQVGDFYEAFCDAAERVSRLCEITLTKREDSTGTYAMAGIPIDNAESYIETLLDAGYRVAVADQVQDPEETTGVVDRAVTRILTPGTLTEDELLAAEDNNFVACLATGTGDRLGLALLDLSTGDFFATSASEEDPIADELGRFSPSEAIVGPDAPVEFFDADCMVTPYDQAVFDLDRAGETVRAYFGPPDRLLAADAEVSACGALLDYAEYTRGSEGDEDGERGRLDYLNHLTRYDPREYMLLDAVAVESLELFERRAVHGRAGATLVEVLDETACAMGSRELKDWLRRPLVDRDRIEARHDAVGELVGDVRTRERLHDLLRSVYDIERLVSRLARGRANARDLRSLHETLSVVPDVDDVLADCECGKLRSLRERLDHLADVRDRIDRAIREDSPIEVTEGGVIADGYDDELDDLRETERSGKEWVASLQASERERTGIDSLKVGKNAVHGYYIEVTDANLDAVPEDYERRQTLKNAERYYTPELKAREEEILQAEQRADDLEYRLFTEVRDAVAAESERAQALAGTLAELDVLVSLATVAATADYTRPGFVEDPKTIDVEGGRHPVVERTQESFVPNDTAIDDEAFVAIVTGPNMSGKSTYMRQVALIQLLAQAGSFVPAASARLSLVDRVFTRVGASDDIAGGKSTFMVEMTELADILTNATTESLVLLDEVGRGTATTDGLAIARAVTEHLHDQVGARTLFATHHHELTAVAETLDGVVNRHFRADQVDEHPDGPGRDDAERAADAEVVFDHEIRPGRAAASYGVEVASEAGVPDSVVERASELLAAADEWAAHEGTDDARSTAGTVADPTADRSETDVTNGHGPSVTGVATESEASARSNGHGSGETRVGDSEEPEPSAGSGDAVVDQELVTRLREQNLAETTPLEALYLLQELQGLVRD